MKTKENKEELSPVRCVCRAEAIVVQSRGKKTFAHNGTERKKAPLLSGMLWLVPLDKQGGDNVSKYRSRKVTVGGITFDSKKEYNRWCELCLLQKAGKITGLDRQVKFELIPAQKRTVVTGERYKRDNLARGIRAGDPKTKEVCLEQACVYIADFVYREDGRQIVEDTKGVRTADYIIKRKLMLWVYGIKIKEV